LSEFEKLAGDAEKFAQQHPEQVEKGEQAVERKLGLPEQDQPGQNQGQGQGQDQAQGQNQEAGTGGEDQQNTGYGGGQ
jgi:hypothetical protein